MIRDQELAGLAMTLGRDAKIKITVGGDNSYCKNDGSHINIARMPSTSLGRMLMTGLVFHEIGHKNFTTGGGRPDGLLGDMINVVEDIRVDMKTIESRPGTCFNLEAVTTHYINKGSLEPKNLTHALLGKVMAYGFGRILKQAAILALEDICNEMMDDAFGSEFIDDVDAIIKDMDKLCSTADSRVMAQKLIDLLVQQKAPPHQPQPQTPASSITQSAAQGTPSDASHEPNDPQTQQTQHNQGQAQRGGQWCNDDLSGTQRQGEDGTEENPQQGQRGMQASGSGAGASRGGGKRPTVEEIDKMLKNNTGYGDLSSLIQKELDEIADNTPYKVLAGIPLLPDIGRLRALHGKLNEVEAISASSRMRARLMGMLQSMKMQPTSYGLSGRKLAAGRLVRMATGDPRIFRKKVEAVEVNTAVMVLLDLSGSMCSRYRVANAAAFALHTTLFGLKGVAVCSAEFSGKNVTPEINILVDFGRKPLSENFNHYPFDGTPTHNAIWAGRALLLQRPEPRKILLILTDGCPDNGAATRSATQKALKDGIEIAAIGIMDGSVRNYWNNHKVIKTIQELPSAMFGIMEGLLTRRNTATA